MSDDFNPLDGYSAPDDVTVIPFKPKDGAGKGRAERSAPAKPVDLPMIRASAWAGLPIPERVFLDAKGLMPEGRVTILYGELAAAVATGQPWLGIGVGRGPVVYFSAEDTATEMHIRLSAICAQSGASIADLQNLHIAEMAGRECVLASNDGKGLIKPNALYGAFLAQCEAIRPRLIIIDNAIDVFAGDQNDGAQVKQFMHVLTGLSLRTGAFVLLLAHPSRAGMATGSGDAGSVHWSNSSGSRLYLNRVLSDGGNGQPVEDDPCARVLKVMKANYAATGDTIALRWEAGCFAYTEAEKPEPGDLLGQGAKDERVFLHLLSVFAEQGRHVSHSPSSTYAPALFGKHSQREGVTKQRFERAMNRLFDLGKIIIETHGPASKERRHIAIVEGDE
jgi:RecA-family ATPase